MKLLRVLGIRPTGRHPVRCALEGQLSHSGLAPDYHPIPEVLVDFHTEDLSVKLRQRPRIRAVQHRLFKPSNHGISMRSVATALPQPLCYERSGRLLDLVCRMTDRATTASHAAVDACGREGAGRCKGGGWACGTSSRWERCRVGSKRSSREAPGQGGAVEEKRRWQSVGGAPWGLLQVRRHDRLGRLERLIDGLGMPAGLTALLDHLALLLDRLALLPWSVRSPPREGGPHYRGASKPTVGTLIDRPAATVSSAIRPSPAGSPLPAS